MTCPSKKVSRTKKIRVLIAKPGLDEHTWGAMIVAQGLRDAGMEVIYLEMATPEQIAMTAIQEDVQVLGLSISSGAHLVLLPKVVKLLRNKGQRNILVIAGGSIPQQDVPALKEAGIAEVFGTSTEIKKIAEYVKTSLKE